MSRRPSLGPSMQTLLIVSTFGAFAAGACSRQTTPEEITEISPQQAWVVPAITMESEHTEFQLRGSPITVSSGEPFFRAMLEADIRRFFFEENFAEIERLADIYRGGARTGSGLFKHGLLYGAFADYEIASRKGILPIAEKKFDAWIKAYPNSPVPYIAMSNAHFRIITGISGSSSGAPNERLMYEKALQMGQGFLSQHWDIVKTEPDAYREKMRYALLAGGSPAEWRAVLSEARSAFPGYYQIYFDANLFAPETHGNPQEAFAVTEEVATALIQEAFAVTEEIATALMEDTVDEGMSGYARTYWGASRRRDISYFMSHETVDWEKMRLGFQDMLDAYPDAWNLNAFARFSCIFGDKEMVQKLQPVVIENPINEIWSKTERNQCFAFAAS